MGSEREPWPESQEICYGVGPLADTRGRISASGNPSGIYNDDNDTHVTFYTTQHFKALSHLLP
jgi:hypothetical protein